MKRTTFCLLTATILMLASASASAGGHDRHGHKGYYGGHVEHYRHGPYRYPGHQRHYRRHYGESYLTRKHYYGPRHGYAYYSGPAYGFGFAVNYRPVYGSYYRRVTNDWFCPGADGFVVERTYYYRSWDARHGHYHYGY